MHEAPGTAEGFFFLLYFGYFPLRAELFPPDGLLFLLQGRQAVAVFEFVLPAFTAQGGVHGINGVLPGNGCAVYLRGSAVVIVGEAAPVAGLRRLQCYR